MPLQCSVVGHLCVLGVTELSTLKSKQAACLGFALKSGLLTGQSALGFQEGPTCPADWAEGLCAEGNGGAFCFT